MKILKYFLIIFFSFTFLICSVPNLSRFIFSSGIIPDDYRFGDLYRMSNLVEFKKLKSVCQKEKKIANSNNHLYVLGDSFLEAGRIQLHDFPVSKYQYSHLNLEAKLDIDTSKNNILLIETVERHIRNHFNTKVLNYKIDLKITNDNLQIIEVFNSEKFQALFFSNIFFEKIKEFKAYFNLNIFERTNPIVRISKDKKHILTYLDVDDTQINSNFYPIENEEIELIVSNLNETKKHYLNLGFDQVYLSIIPNKTTICCQKDGKYNQIINKIQSNKNLKVSVIDILKIFENKNYYEIGDTHWNCEGQAAYLKLVNQQIFNEK